MDKKGFSLIEMLLVVTILGILIGIVSLNIRLSRRHNVRAGIHRLEELRNAIRDIRNECGGYPYPGITDSNLDSLICNTDVEPPCANSEHLLRIWPTNYGCANAQLATGFSGNICNPANEFHRIFTEDLTTNFSLPKGSCNNNEFNWNIDIYCPESTNTNCGSPPPASEIQKAPEIIVYGAVLGPYGPILIRMGLDGTDKLMDGCPTGPYCEDRNLDESGCCKDIGYSY